MEQCSTQYCNRDWVLYQLQLESVAQIPVVTEFTAATRFCHMHIEGIHLKHAVGNQAHARVCYRPDSSTSLA